MKVAFGSVAYDNAWKYRGDFVNSLNAQLDSEFDILIINDDIDNARIKELVPLSNREFRIFPKPRPMTIAELRIYLIATAKKSGYDLLVLGDFDDKFHCERVKNIVDQYDNSYGFYYHQLSKFDGTSIFKSMPPFLKDFREILDFNMLGLSNTAINLNLLSNDFIDSLSEGKTAIFDWYLYTRLLLNGLQGIYIKDALTYYRIYEENIAGIEVFDEAHFRKEIAVKLQHYKLLEKYADIFQKRMNQFRSISKCDYSHYINYNSKGYWWDKIHP